MDRALRGVRGGREAPYSYSQFCEIFAAGARRLGVSARFVHVPGEKCYVDWAGDTCWLTDPVSGRRARAYVLVICLPYSGWMWARAYVLVICLPYSGWMWARAYPDMGTGSWPDGHMGFFEAILQNGFLT